MPPRKRGRKPAVSKPEPADQVKTDPEPEPVDQVEPKVDLNTTENNEMEEEEVEEEVEYEEVEEEVEYEEVEEEEELVEEEEEEIEEEQEEERETNEGKSTSEQKEANRESENEKKIHAELLAKPPQGSEVYLGGIPTDATEEEVKGFCEACGEVAEVSYITLLVTSMYLFRNWILPVITGLYL
jgi:heterogeneous nuclear ribonucleoprotein R